MMRSVQFSAISAEGCEVKPGVTAWIKLVPVPFSQAGALFGDVQLHDPEGLKSVELETTSFDATDIAPNGMPAHGVKSYDEWKREATQQARQVDYVTYFVYVLEELSRKGLLCLQFVKLPNAVEFRLRLSDVELMGKSPEVLDFFSIDPSMMTKQ